MTGVVSVAALAILVTMVILLFPLDFLRRRIHLRTPSERVDERDTMFARMARKPTMPPYEEYYSRHPELKESDDRIRRLPLLMEPGGLYYHDRVMQEAKAHFDAIAGVVLDKELVRNLTTRLKDAGNPSEELRDVALELGAVAVGFASLSVAFLYTMKGRLDKDYGKEVLPDHSSALVFLVEMDYEEMRHAPHAETLRESARQYYRAARIAKTLEAVLVTSGYKAKAHYDAHYDVILPPLAVWAGLGELGRNNILVADRFGSRVRIGAVTTDCPFTPSKPTWLGVDDFCALCKKCAENCPSRALTEGHKVPVHGVAKWPTNVEKCYTYWRTAGTDCGICMAVCPFSHRNNWFHNLVRFLIRLNPLIRRVALFFDDAIYGRRWNPRARFSAKT